MRLSAILFDKDGTFVDFQRTWGPAAYQTMHSLSGGDPDRLTRLADAIHYTLDDQSFRETSPFIAGSNQDLASIWGAILERGDTAVLAAEISQLLRAASLKATWPIGRPLETFAALVQRGLKLGVATNNSEASAHAQIEILELGLHLDFVAGYNSGYGGKPEPGMVLAFAQKFNIPPGEIALVGNSRHDLDAARAAGAVAIAVLSGPAQRHDLEPHADHVVDAIDALPALVDRLRAAA